MVSGPDSVIAASTSPVRECLFALRDLIREVAAHTEGVGPLEETLKWGQPAFVTSVSKSGTTLRIGAVRDRPTAYALYFHCQSSLADQFRQHYEDDLTIEGNRAIILDSAAPVPEEALRHCIALALTYHQRKMQ